MPEYTSDPARAARGFSLHTSYIEDLNASDLSKGDGKELYRYLHVHYHPYGYGRPVSSVYLRETKMGDGQTEDLNISRGGRYLYLCWTYS